MNGTKAVAQTISMILIFLRLLRGGYTSLFDKGLVTPNEILTFLFDRVFDKVCLLSFFHSFFVYKSFQKFLNLADLDRISFSMPQFLHPNFQSFHEIYLIEIIKGATNNRLMRTKLSGTM